ncbi:MAG: aminotransferase class I/II-fold pyridoxal phosphate-dependent enzyme, partial [Gammaproteobacteria bacterium]|nr:aminotransferase class I/II-fold pyridoxal phosphate-dependent enzyme [Gammaproteobacteria bacterium]
MSPQIDSSKSNIFSKDNFRHKLEKKLELRKQQNLFRKRITLASRQGPTIKIDGHHLINFCSNDYLGLANHPDVISAFKTSADQFGVGSSASSLVCGRSNLHHQLEKKLADK